MRIVVLWVDYRTRRVLHRVGREDKRTLCGLAVTSEASNAEGARRCRRCFSERAEAVMATEARMDALAQQQCAAGLL